MKKRIYESLKSKAPLKEDQIILDRVQKSNFNFKKLEIVGGTIKTNKPFVGVVGARFPTNYGRQVTTMIVRDLAEAGAVIVSGLMYGIDLIAHNTALNCGGKTIGVLGYGFDSLPKMGFAQKTYTQILNSKDSFLISQFEADYPPSKWTYPNRNMLIAALSDVLVVVEAGLKSGSLITANFMLDLNKDIFAVPGSILNAKSKGTNTLIKEGAFLLDSPDELLNTLNLHKQSKISSEEKQILLIVESKKRLNLGELKLISGFDDFEFSSILGKLKFLRLINIDGVIVSSRV